MISFLVSKRKSVSAACLLLLVAVIVTMCPAAYAQTLREFIQVIESRRHDWYQLHSDVRLEFKTAHGQTASCDGTLSYLRLEEKMLLQCFNEEGETLFVFRTHDVDFELLLPKQKMLYQGNIFDLEHSDKIDSHLKPYDIYRALIPFRIPVDRAHLEASDDSATALWVSDQKEGTEYPTRRLVATNSGDVITEMYLKRDGSPSLIIDRKDFQAFQKNASDKDDFAVLPRYIEITDPDSETQTRIHFETFSFSVPLSGDWALDYPEDTQVMKVTEIEKPSFRPGRYFAPR